MSEPTQAEGPPNYRRSVARCAVCRYCVINSFETYVGRCILHLAAEGGWRLVEPEGLCDSFERRWNDIPLYAEDKQ